jgi:hypothetical protein
MGVSDVEQKIKDEVMPHASPREIRKVQGPQAE